MSTTWVKLPTVKAGGPMENQVAVGQNPVIPVNIKIGGTWVFIRPKMGSA